MKVYCVAVTASALLSAAALAALVFVDRRLGLPVPYAACAVVALLNALATLALPLLNRRPSAAVSAARRLPAAVHVSARTSAPAAVGGPVKEAVVWFHLPAVGSLQEEAA